MIRPARTLIALAVLGLVSLGPVVAAGAASTDPLFGHQWGMERIGAPEAWATGTGEGTVVAVIDSGVDASHPDLAANVGAGRDFIDPGTPPDDANGHGTHVAGVVGAVTGNGVGVAGVAGGTKIMPVRVLDDEGVGTLGQVEQGIRYAVDRGADVINLSLGGDVVIENLTGGSLAPAIDEAWEAGVVVVVAAGNDALFPSGYRDVDAIVVSATGPQDEKPAYSNGVGLAKWGMAAPGGNSAAGGEAGMILSTYWSEEDENDEDDKERYAWAQGTSMATPHVAGAAAVLRGLGLGPQETVDRLLATARDIGSPGDDLVFGAGRLDVAAAVEGLGAVRDRGEEVPGPEATPDSSEAPREASSPRSAPTPEAPTSTEEPVTASEGTPDAPVEPEDVPDPDEEGVVAVDVPSDGGGSSGLAGVVAAALVVAAAVSVALFAGVRRGSGAGEQPPE